MAVNSRSLFSTLKAELRTNGYRSRSQEAVKWFRSRVAELNGRINRSHLLFDPLLRIRNEPVFGTMHMFVYDPKLKDVLPYYDKFPLAIMIGPAEGGFLGLNLHYLRPDVRAMFLDKLIETMGDDKLTEKSRLAVRYSLLKKATKFRFFKPCIKHYLFSHVKSRIAMVPATQWEVATFLPTEDFAKSTKQSVWAESLKIANETNE